MRSLKCRWCWDFDEIAFGVLRTTGLRPVVSGRADGPERKGPHVVTSQKPRPGVMVPAGSEVELGLAIR
jgi:hypothetical protein